MVRRENLAATRVGEYDGSVPTHGSEAGTATRPSFVVRRSLLAVSFASVGLVVATVSSRWAVALDLGRRWDRVPAGCYELDHCGRSSWWAVAFLFVVWGPPAAAFAVVGWRVASRMSGSVLLRAALLLAVGTLAYHCVCDVLFVVTAWR